MSTSVSSVVNHFPSAENGFTTTTSGSVSSGATTVGLNSVAGYTNGETVVFIIDPTNAKKQTFTGVIDTSGVQVTDVVWTAGSNVSHDAGATVVDYATATHISMISKGILEHANQDGTLKDDAVTTDVITDANVTTAKLADESVTNAKLATGAGEPGGEWNTWTHGFSGFTGGSETVVAAYKQVGKTVHFRIKSTLGATPSAVTNFTFSTPVTGNSEQLVNDALNGSATAKDANGGITIMAAYFNSSSQVIVRAVSTSGSNYGTITTPSTTIPFAFASGDSISVAGTYEAA